MEWELTSGEFMVFKVDGTWGVTNSDFEVFPEVSMFMEPGSPCLSPHTHQAWAKASGRYEGYPEDPAKWKTNFRCALRSTRMFTMREDHSKCGDDPHKVFAINPGEPSLMGGCVGGGAGDLRVPRSCHSPSISPWAWRGGRFWQP